MSEVVVAPLDAPGLSPTRSDFLLDDIDVMPAVARQMAECGEEMEMIDALAANDGITEFTREADRPAREACFRWAKLVGATLDTRKTA